MKLASPFVRFAANEAAGGLILLACAIVAMVWANSGGAPFYFDLLEKYFDISFGGQEIIHKNVSHWINDGLMAVFFLLVGLEIKREVLVGELRSIRLAALPMMAALGGMVVPAAIYAIMNAGGAGARGWGIPMATDIAFALGLLGLLGSRVPLALKVFLTALAIVDDIGAILVIAVFYTSNMDMVSLGWAFAGVAGLLVLNKLGVKALVPYLFVGIIVWYFVLKSGIHATVAGILVAVTIPARSLISLDEFAKAGKEILSKLENSDPEGGDNDESALHELSKRVEQAESPLHRLEHLLHPWVAFFIIPVFAVANAGVALPSDLGAVASNPVTLGVAIGLIAGKLIGVFSFSWLAVKLKIADLPKNVTWSHIGGASCLAGVGFTMSLFIAVLAFSDPLHLESAKLGILCSSLLAGALGLFWLWRLKPVSDEA